MNKSWIALLLFIIGLAMSVLLNLVSVDFQEWYLSNRRTIWIALIALTVIGGWFVFFQEDTSVSRPIQTNSTDENTSKALENLHACLENADQTLQSYKIDAARYTSFDMPHSLKVKIQEKEKEVISLKNEIELLANSPVKDNLDNLWILIFLIIPFLSFVLSNPIIDNLIEQLTPQKQNSEFFQEDETQPLFFRPVNSDICSYPTRLSKGERAFVELVSQKHNNIRIFPSTSSDITGTIDSGEYVTLLDGPHCAENWWWWRIRTANEKEGWTSEGDLTSYWLIPENYLPETATILFYESLNIDIKDKDFGHSFNFMSNRYKKVEGPLSNWASKFSSTVRVDVTNVVLLRREGVAANVRVDYAAIDRDGWQEVQQKYSVVWNLVVENGEWKLDKGIID